VYSQNDEERWIVNHFQNINPAQSRFLDIGAYDGKTFSNTLRLAELGWNGLCIEPAPSCFLGLMGVHKDNPRVELLNAAVIPGNAAKILPFHDSNGDAVSTLVDAHVVKWQASAKFRKFYIPALPIGAVFAQFGTGFEFLNLDVESLNIELFRELPLAQMPSLRLICVEHDGHYGEMMAITAPLGFQMLTRNPENIIFGR